MRNIRIQHSHSVLSIAYRLLDACTIGGSLFFSQWLAGQDPSDRTWLVALVSIVIYFLAGEATNIYQFGKTRSANFDLALVVGNWVLTILVLSVLAFFTRHGMFFARSSIFSWILVTGATLGLVRMWGHIATAAFNSAGWSSQRCAIAGLNPLGMRLFQNANDHPECGLRMVGFYDDRTELRTQVVEDDESENFSEKPATSTVYKGKINELVTLAKSGEIDTVFITLPMRAESRIRWLLDQLADTTVNAYIVPDFFVFELLHSRWNSIGGLPAVSVFESPLYGVDGWLKRFFDFAIALSATILLSPVLLTCALLVKYSSPGPVFFRQRRYGLDGREILVWKFRSMTTCENGSQIRQATKNDQRITPIGAILRQTSLDELPQLFNVLEGSMSLVGPRPHATAHNEHYRKLIRGYMLRHKVRPGITGLAQVAGCRGETETLEKMQKRIEYDHQYIQQWSLWLDLKILVQTIWVVLKQENAY